MRLAKLTTDQGKTWETNCNGTDLSICSYFLGGRFNLGGMGWDHENDCETEVDNVQICVRCEIDGKAYELDKAVNTLQKGLYLQSIIYFLVAKMDGTDKSEAVRNYLNGSISKRIKDLTVGQVYEMAKVAGYEGIA